MHKRDTREGFTLVELSLSLVFIAILSVAVVLVITGAISSYHRSITLNKIDTIGTSLADDMKKSVQSSTANNLLKLCDEKYQGISLDDVRQACKDDGGKNLVVVSRNAVVKSKADNKEMDVPVLGALCTGSYSYIWNSGYFFTDNYVLEGVAKARLIYKIDGIEKTKADFKLLRVEDETRAVCEAAVKTDTVTTEWKNDRYDATIGSDFDMSVLTDVSEEPVEYLGSSENSENNLALYYLTSVVSRQSESSRSTYYYSSFVLGTLQGGINVNASGNFCAAPEGGYKSVENLSYCSINKFNFAALAVGG